MINTGSFPDIPREYSSFPYSAWECRQYSTTTAIPKSYQDARPVWVPTNDQGNHGNQKTPDVPRESPSFPCSAWECNQHSTTTAIPKSYQNARPVWVPTNDQGNHGNQKTLMCRANPPRSHAPRGDADVGKKHLFISSSGPHPLHIATLTIHPSQTLNCAINSHMKT